MTSEEIVRALRCCESGECSRCPLYSDKQFCQEKLLYMAAELIERLEKEKAALLAQLKGRCDLCKYFSGNGIRKRCWDTLSCTQCNVECSCRDCYASSKWEWKGVKEDSDGQIC